MQRAEDFDRFSEALIVLAEAFDVRLSAARINLYFEGLSDRGWPAVETAFGQALRTCKFFPKIAELRELAAGGSHEDQAEHAWSQFWLVLQRFGTYRSLYCEDPVLAETVRRLYGSWADAGNIPRIEADSAAHQVHHKNFVTTYGDLARHPQPYDPYLVGQIEATNLATLAYWERGMPLEPEVTYLPRQGNPESRPLRVLQPDHVLVRLLDQAMQPVLPAADEDATS
jgi:hypothetical protein